MSTSDAGGDLNFEETVSWRVSVAIAGYIALCKVAEVGLHRLKHHFAKNVHTLGLVHAVECLKDELLNVGFISIALVSTQQWLINICVDIPKTTTGVYCPAGADNKAGGRWLSEEVSVCSSRAGKQPFISATTLHQTHIMIFSIALCQVFFTCLTMVASQAVVKSWGWWEVIAARGDSPFPATERFHVFKTYVRRFLHIFMTCVCRNPDKPLLKLNPPPKRYGWWQDALLSSVGQFMSPINPSSFLTLRQWFLARHELPATFDFGLFTLRCCQKVGGRGVPVPLSVGSCLYACALVCMYVYVCVCMRVYAC